MTRIRIRVHEIKGTCPVFKKNDQIVFDGPELVKDETDAYCVWASASFLPYLLAVRYGIPADEIGLSKEKDSYFVQCLDPGPPHTSGGTVVFEMVRENEGD